MEENKKSENPQAFPQTWERDGSTDNWENGMSLRDYFANTAMQGIMIGEDYKYAKTAEDVAKGAYAVADAMLKQREL